MGGAFSSSNNSSSEPKSKKKKPEISAADRATLDLKVTRDKLQQYKTKLERDDARIIARAKKAKTDGNTKGALSLLKIRQIKKREVESVEQQLLNVLQMVQTIDSKKNEVQVLAAMREGKDALKKMHEETTVDNILNLMDDIQEEHELEKEMNGILQNCSLSVEDEAGIEAELALLMGGQPTSFEIQQQQQQDSEQLPIAPDTTPLPQVPSTKLPATADSLTTSEKVAVAS